MRWAIYGTNYEDNYGRNCSCMLEEERIVATFDTEKSAKDYLQKSELKNPKWQHKFRSKSLLSLCEYAHVDEYYSDGPPPHEPEL